MNHKVHDSFDQDNKNTAGLVDLSSSNAPEYLRGNLRRIEGEKARQARAMKRLEEEERFFYELLENVLIPKSLVTDKEKGFIFIKDEASRSKNFWEQWLANYKLASSLNGSSPLKTYMSHEFHENPVKLLQNKMGKISDNIFDFIFYLEKIAKFAADLQTEWKNCHLCIQKSDEGANILIEEQDSSRNLDAQEIVYKIWDLMNDLNDIYPVIVNYYNTAVIQLNDLPAEPDIINRIFRNIFEKPSEAKHFERNRFGLLIKYSDVIFAVKDNWERRLERKYDGFTDFNDVKNTIETFVEKRYSLIDAMF